MSLICPYADAGTCSVYKNWTEKMHETRINIIYDGANCSCMALDSLKDPTTEGGILGSKELVKIIDGLKSVESFLPESVGCSHITLLNLLRNKK